MILSFLAGIGATIAYQKRENWLPKIKQIIKENFPKKEKTDKQQEFDFTGKI